MIDNEARVGAKANPKSWFGGPKIAELDKLKALLPDAIALLRAKSLSNSLKVM